MGVNKVVFGAVSIFDISDSTVTPETLADGAVAYGADGERIIGKMKAPGSSEEISETCTVIVQLDFVNTPGKYWNDSKYVVSYYKMIDGVKTRTEARLVNGVDYTFIGSMRPKFTLECVCGTLVFATLSDMSAREYTFDVPEEIDDFKFLRATTDTTTEISAIGYAFTAPKEPGTYTITILYNE